MTDLEKTLLEATPEEYKYIARDECGYLFLYAQKPFKDLRNQFWQSCGGNYNAFDIYDYLFQDIKWEDEKPYKFR